MTVKDVEFEDNTFHLRTILNRAGVECIVRIPDVDKPNAVAIYIKKYDRAQMYTAQGQQNYWSGD